MQPSVSDTTPLLAERLRQGLSREQVAERAGIDPVTVWRVETGRVTPRRATRGLLAYALARDPADLFPDTPGEDGR